MPYVAYFMKNQSLHGGFILPIQLDNFFYSEQNRLLPSSDVAQPAPLHSPQIENNIRLDAVFKKPSDIFRKLVGHGDKGVVCRKRRVPVEQHIIDYGSTSLLKSYSLESVRIFRQAPANARAYTPCIQIKGAVLKAAGYFIKSIYYSHSSVPTILSNYFTCFDICISPLHSKPMAE